MEKDPAKPSWDTRGGGFKHFWFSLSTWGNVPIWLIFFKWVETTNQYIFTVWPPRSFFFQLKPLKNDDWNHGNTCGLSQVFRSHCGPNHLHAMIRQWGFESKDFWRNMFPIGDSPISDPTPHSMYGRFTTYIWLIFMVNVSSIQWVFEQCAQIFLKKHLSMLEDLHLLRSTWRIIPGLVSV